MQQPAQTGQGNSGNTRQLLQAIFGPILSAGMTPEQRAQMQAHMPQGGFLSGLFGLGNSGQNP